MRARFQARALEQLEHQFEYIAAEDAHAALRVWDRIMEALKQLEEFPQSGRVIPEFPHRPEREIIVPPYRIQYRIVREDIWIVAVWHGRQDVTEEEQEA